LLFGIFPNANMYLIGSRYLLPMRYIFAFGNIPKSKSCISTSMFGNV